MAQHHTKDERYVICLYEAAQQGGDPEGCYSRYTIGEHAHLQPKAVDAICKLLVQANFIKKDGEEDIYLTANGIALAERLLNE